MKRYLANAPQDALDSGCYPIDAVLGVFPATSVLYGVTMLLPHLLVANWHRTRTAKRGCVKRAAIRCRILKGSQS